MHEQANSSPDVRRFTLPSLTGPQSGHAQACIALIMPLHGSRYQCPMPRKTGTNVPCLPPRHAPITAVLMPALPQAPMPLTAHPD